MKKRTWVYVLRPAAYEIACDLCGGSNLDWSEWEDLVWCYDCQKDTRGDGGVFAGPIPLDAMDMLGMSLDRIYLPTGRRMKPVLRNSRVVYESVAEKEITDDNEVTQMHL